MEADLDDELHGHCGICNTIFGLPIIIQTRRGNIQESRLDTHIDNILILVTGNIFSWMFMFTWIGSEMRGFAHINKKMNMI